NASSIREVKRNLFLRGLQRFADVEVDVSAHVSGAVRPRRVNLPAAVAHAAQLDFEVSPSHRARRAARGLDRHAAGGEAGHLAAVGAHEVRVVVVAVFVLGIEQLEAKGVADVGAAQDAGFGEIDEVSVHGGAVEPEVLDASGDVG